MLLLAQFLYRLSFGMAAAMAITPPRLVTSGYYRNNLYVLLGMNTLAALVAWGGFDGARGDVRMWLPALLAAVLSYFGAAVWLYEKPRAGITILALIALSTLFGTIVTTPTRIVDSAGLLVAEAGLLANAGSISSGLLLGFTMAAMLLGHWYLNAPGMKITPLFRLTAGMAGALALRTVVCVVSLAMIGIGSWVNSNFTEAGAVEPLGQVEWFMLALRWLAGILGTAGLIVMTWSTLKIPNTQAATGMLYVAVITTFLGELIGQLLSVGSLYPL